MSGRGTRAVEALTKAGVRFSIHEYELPPPRHEDRGYHAYGAESVAALGVEPERVFKTLVADVDGGLVVGVVPVSGELDLKALAGAVGGRRGVMADPHVAERATGYVVGGISPLGQRRRLPIVLDDSALGHETVFVSGGRRGFQIEIAPEDLVSVAAAMTARIGRASTV